MTHYEERLEADLERIRQELNALAGGVSAALQGAMRAFLAGDDEAAHETVLGDHPINRASRNLDRLCHAFIARHLPSAYHLRLMSSIIRVNIALERIGDYAVTIAREALQLTDPPGPSTAQQLTALTHQVESLLDDAVAAFVDGNADSARALMSIPQQVENSMDGVYDGLIDSGKKRTRREMVVYFVVFGLLKRVADQAKNICDQTIFAMTGEIKPTKVFSILFVDESNSYRSQMATAIARKRYPNNGKYVSAGRSPHKAVDRALIEFLEDHGVDSSEISCQGIDAVQSDLMFYDVVVSLDKKVKKYFLDVPFHTSTLRWKIDTLAEELGDEEKQAQFEETYRELTVKIDELMHLLVGDDAS